ncbi:aminotransferase class V-fold PLP-dependent enzyme, partial [Shewanella sp. 0m-11]
EAAAVAKADMDVDNQRIRRLRDKLWNGINHIEETYINGDMENRYCGSLNVSFNFVEGESLMMALKDLAVSSGSACTSASLEPSYVLRALGLNDEMAHSSIRFSIGRFTTDEEIDHAIETIKESIGNLREMSPLWEMFKDGIDLDSVQWAHH